MGDDSDLRKWWDETFPGDLSGQAEAASKCTTLVALGATMSVSSSAPQLSAPETDQSEGGWFQEGGRHDPHDLR